MNLKWAKAIMIFLASCFIACATVSTERTRSDFEKDEAIKPYPPYSGAKTRVQIVRFGIPDDIVKKYPELARKRIGFGLSNRLIEGFYDCGRFEFVEEKRTMLEHILEQWKLSQSGIYAEEEPIPIGGLKAPQFLIYAEVYDFSVSYSEVVRGVAVQKTNTTIIGIQIRMVDVATGKYIPASGVGEARSTAASVWANPKLKFDQSTVGIASQRAVDAAIRKLLARLNARG